MTFGPTSSLEFVAALHRLGFEVRITTSEFLVLARYGSVIYVPRSRVLEDADIQALALMGNIHPSELGEVLPARRISGEVWLSEPGVDARDGKRNSSR